MKKILKIVASINLKMCYVAMVSLFVLMFMTTIDTITRKTPIGGITDSLDLTELLIILIVFCGFAYLESEKGHIRVDMFVNMFPRVLKKVTEVLMYLLSSGILFLLLASMIRSVGSTYRSGAATQILHIPHWPFIVVSGAAIFLFAVTVTLHTVELIITKDGDMEAAA